MLGAETHLLLGPVHSSGATGVDGKYGNRCRTWLDDCALDLVAAMLVVRLGGRTDAHTVEPGDVTVIDTAQIQDQVLSCPGFRDIQGT